MPSLSRAPRVKIAKPRDGPKPGADNLAPRCRARGVPSSDGSGRGDRHRLRLAIRDAARKDPDARSPTLRRYHRLLWSKPLPSGAPLELDVTTPGAYLHHLSELGQFFLSSDAVIPSFSRARELKHLIDQI